MAGARDRRTTWAVVILVLLILFLLLSRCSGSSGSSKVGSVPNRAGPAEPAPAPTGPADSGTSAPETNNADSSRKGTSDSGDGAGDPSGQDPNSGPLTVDGRTVHSGDLPGLTGKRVIGDSARVLTVPADEGFWISTGGSDRVFVQLTGMPPESPYTVLPGDEVSFSGQIAANGNDFAHRVGVTQAEGSATLTAQRQHVNVTKRGLSLMHP